MMMTRVLLTFLVGLVVSLGALVSVGPVLAKNWNLKSDTAEPSESIGSTYEGVNCQPTMTQPSQIKLLGSYEDSFICERATGYGDGQKISNKCFARQYVIELRRRNIDCGLGAVPNVVGPDLKRLSVQLLEKSHSNDSLAAGILAYSDSEVCENATFGGQRREWFHETNNHVKEAKRRGLSCGVGEASNIQIANTTRARAINYANNMNYGGHEFRSRMANKIVAMTATELCKVAPGSMGFEIAKKEIKYRDLSCGVTETTQTASATPVPKIKPKATSAHINFASQSDKQVCHFATVGGDQKRWYPVDYESLGPGDSQFGYEPMVSYVKEAKRRGLSCGVDETTQTASAPVPKAKPKVTSAALSAAEKEAERLRQRVAALEAEKAKQQQTIASDTQIPLITITQSGADGRKGSVKGYAKDNVQVAEVLIDGQAVRLGNDGSFEWSGFVPSTGKEITIEAIDTAALSSTKTVSLKRGQIQQASSPRFDVLDPTAGKKVKRNSNALALIVGISDYERTDAPAVYADKDAQYFHDYASLKLGIPDSNIKTMVNAKAEQGDVILAVKDWMRRSSKPGKTDVYVFFAGHGLASDDGEQMYLLPYDGRPRLLDKTAILREELFDDIASANPRSVTVFLDTCYSGTTRGTDMLIASRPIAIKALEQSIPDNFTVMTAAAGDQTAKPLEEAKHGMFSYFLMKGMEGEADKNQDNKITAGELHSYVQSNVVQQSSGSQTPELQGDAGRVLVRFQ